MSIALIIGVLLIAGVVTPVIANVSDDSGSGSGETFTNEGPSYLSATTPSTSVTFYPVSNYQYSTQPDSVADRPVYDAPLYILATDYAYTILVSTRSGSWYFDVSSSDDSVWSGYADMITLSGTTLIFTPRGGGTEVTQNDIIYYSTETGDYACVLDMSPDLPENKTFFANNDTPVYCFGRYASDAFSSSPASFVINGTVGSNTLTVTGAEADSDSADITITDNQISSISFSIESVNILLDPASIDGSAVDDNLWSFCLVLPVEVSGSGSGSGIPQTLSTTLSVIPLVLTVGLVLGAVTYLRMKN